MINCKEFSEKSIDPDPIVQFKSWYNEHLSSGMVVPDSVCLATGSAAGQVSARTVLLKNFDWVVEWLAF